MYAFVSVIRYEFTTCGPRIEIQSLKVISDILQKKREKERKKESKKWKIIKSLVWFGFLAYQPLQVILYQILFIYIYILNY